MIILEVNPMGDSNDNSIKTKSMYSQASGAQAQFPTIPLTSCIPTVQCVPTITSCAQAQTIPTVVGCAPTINGCFPTSIVCDSNAGGQAQFPTIPLTSCVPTVKCIPTITSCAQAQTIPTVIGCIPTIPGCIPTVSSCDAHSAAGAQAQFPTIPLTSCVPTVQCIPTITSCAQAQTIPTVIGCIPTIPGCIPTVSSCDAHSAAGAQAQFPTIPLTSCVPTVKCIPTITSCAQAQTLPTVVGCIPTIPGCIPTVSSCDANAGAGAEAQFPTIPLTSCVPTVKCIPTITSCAQAQTIPTVIGCIPTIPGCIPTVSSCDANAAAGAEAQFPTIPLTSCVPTVKCIPTITSCAQAQTIPTVIGCIPTIPGCIPTVSSCDANAGAGAEAQFPTIPLTSCVPTVKCIPTITSCDQAQFPTIPVNSCVPPTISAKGCIPTVQACGSTTILCVQPTLKGCEAGAEAQFPTIPLTSCVPTVKCIPTITSCGQAQTVFPTMDPVNCVPTISAKCVTMTGCPTVVTCDANAGAEAQFPTIPLTSCVPTVQCIPTITSCAQAQTIVPTMVVC